MAKRKSKARAASATTTPATAAVAAATPTATIPDTTSTAANSAASGTAGRRSKTELRAAAARKRRNQNWMIAAAGGVVLLLIVGLMVANIRGSRPVAGEETFTSQGNLHIPLGSVSPVAYNSMPPTSGPHYENLAAWGYQPQPIRYEHLVHNLEDGGVVIYYQCPVSCPELVDELRDVLEPYFAQGTRVVLTVNDPSWNLGGGEALHQDMGAPIVLTAWRKRLAMDSVDAEIIRAFVENYEGIDHHRG